MRLSVSIVSDTIVGACIYVMMAVQSIVVPLRELELLCRRLKLTHVGEAGSVHEKEVEPDSNATARTELGKQQESAAMPSAHASTSTMRHPKGKDERWLYARGLVMGAAKMALRVHATMRPPWMVDVRADATMPSSGTRPYKTSVWESLEQLALFGGRMLSERLLCSC